ncbi:uncharacterized protein LOC128260652 [Drosophila gunungcola]|uniref:Insulin receptor substrate 1 n=1 Tax=Drosophila gunungcola TaxID=103775 RepID=A0A9P9YEC4_9MUSC|nr:uncharacterized protein LOC128260652 [Drosophila gunungcola]KAI8035454.1 hypothetical protein M5D96_011797 [Drosophila gunungcola]
MDVEIPVLAGYLNVPTQTGFSLNRISKKKACSRYCLLFKASRHGIARLEMCESKEDRNPKMFTLENCVKITQEPPPDRLIHIVKRHGTLTLSTSSEEELKDWITALQTVAFCDTSPSGGIGAIEEDNDLYCSSFDGLFIITLIPSEASIRCCIEPKTYMLQMTPTELQLKSEDMGATIAMWPYRFIRKYGYRDGKFTFEAGRKCTTGEGVFTLDHTNPQEVFRCMSAKMKSMKKLISGDSLSTLECGENQFSAAAGMEPGSRSPLPPSPSNNPHGGEFEINSTQSCISLRGFISSNDSLNNFSSASGGSGAAPVGGGVGGGGAGGVNPVTGGGGGGGITLSVPANTNSKHIPNKPPRKPGGVSPTTHCDKYRNIVKYEPVAITTISSPSATSDVNSSVILKPLETPGGGGESIALPDISPDLPPDLPLRNESASKAPPPERDYECIENITEAWRTRGVGDVRHCERMPILCDTSEFVRQRSVTKSSGGQSTTPKIIDIDIGEGGCTGSATSMPESNYDRLDFLSPNNKTSSGYKTIVNVTGNRNRCSFSPNEYELIASPDTESFRKADDSHLGYGVLRKASSTTNNNNLGISNSNISGNSNVNSSTANKGNLEAAAIDHRSYNGLNYTIVSKPKRV